MVGWHVGERRYGGERRRQAQHPGHLGRRHRHQQPELLQRRADGLPHAQHRPHRRRGDALHRLLRRADLHRRALVVHHRPERVPHRPLQGRASPAPTSGCGPRTPPSPSCSSRWATPPASSARTTWATATSSCPPCTASTSSSATSTTSTPRRSRSCRTTRRPATSPTSGSASARAASPLLGDRRGRPNRAAALGPCRQAAHRGHRAADQEAHGDLRRRVRRRRQGLHHAPARRPGRRSSAGSTPPTCTSAPTPSRRASARPGAGSRPTTTP